MTDQAFAQADPEWLKLIGEARDWLAGPLGQLLLEEERRLLEEELARFFGGYLVSYGPGAEGRPTQGRSSTTCALARRCLACRSSVRSNPGPWVSTPPMWWCCNTAWISVCRPTVCCVRRLAASGLADIC